MRRNANADSLVTFSLAFGLVCYQLRNTDTFLQVRTNRAKSFFFLAGDVPIKFFDVVRHPSLFEIEISNRLEETAMAYNHRKAEIEWLNWKEKEEKQLRGMGVDEDTIQRLHTFS